MKWLALTTCTVGFACGVYAGLNGWPFGWVTAIILATVGMCLFYGLRRVMAVASGRGGGRRG